jgi:hypothetical protein
MHAQLIRVLRRWVLCLERRLTRTHTMQDLHLRTQQGPGPDHPHPQSLTS